MSNKRETEVQTKARLEARTKTQAKAPTDDQRTGGAAHGLDHLVWQNAHGWPKPKRIDTLTGSKSANHLLGTVSQGVSVLWEGDFIEGRALLQAMKRRLADKDRQSQKAREQLPWPDRFHRIRMQRAQAARQFGALLVKVERGYQLPQRRAPDARAALAMAYGDRLQDTTFLMSMTELIGVLSAHQWHHQGLPIAALGHAIYPRWGVFAPTRDEYLDLVLQATLPAPTTCAVDAGTGTGVLAMLLARRGVKHVVATDINPLALACASDNVRRAHLASTIDVVGGDLIPAGQFDLLVCNPPWLPGTPSGALEAAVYDPGHRMLKEFLQLAPQHLTPGGQAWLILSDLAEHLHLRSRQSLHDWIEQAGLHVVSRLDAKPSHRKRLDVRDPLYAARQAEVTSLWQLSSSAEMP